MKRNIIGMFIFLLSAMSVSAAELDMFTGINAQDVQDAQDAGLAKQDTEKKLKYGNYNSNIKANLTVGTKININLPDSNVVVTIKAITKKSKDRFSYTASSDKGTDTVHIAQYKQDIMGSINVDGELYKFTVDKKGSVTIKKVDQDLLIDHDENYTEDVSQDFLDRMKNGDAKSLKIAKLRSPWARPLCRCSSHSWGRPCEEA